MVKSKKIHKFFRVLKESLQYRLCDGKRCDFAENVAYFWRDITCPKCLKKFRQTRSGYSKGPYRRETLR